jgi:hypothetical protein
MSDLIQAVQGGSVVRQNHSDQQRLPEKTGKTGPMARLVQVTVHQIRRFALADKRFSIAIAGFVLITALHPLVQRLPIEQPYKPVTPQSPTAQQGGSPPTTAPNITTPRANSQPDGETLQRYVAATLLLTHYTRYKTMLASACRNEGVDMENYQMAIEKAYAPALAIANQIAGSNAVYLEAFLNHGGQEEGMRRVVQELGTSARAASMSNAAYCRTINANPQPKIRADHFSEAHPAAYKLLMAGNRRM